MTFERRPGSPVVTLGFSDWCDLLTVLDTVLDSMESGDEQTAAVRIRRIEFLRRAIRDQVRRQVPAGARGPQ